MLHGCKNDALISALQESADQSDPYFWSFRRAVPRKGAHALLHYPAMMVPSLQALIMKCVQDSQPDVQSVLDPFVGSGTVLVEAMNHGLDFRGVDINPLAGLSCLAKSGPYFVNSFEFKCLDILTSLSIDKKIYRPREYAGRDKWHEIEASQGLEKISRHIASEPEKWARRLFWLALCRVVRSTSRSRKSTYKLHIEADNTKSPLVDINCLFAEVLDQFRSNLAYQCNEFDSKKLLKNGRYKGAVEIKIADSRAQRKSLDDRAPMHDLVMTSPPYGDNVTTIPYGQFSYLPLQWVDLSDIDEEINVGLVANTHSTDSASLGGTLRGADEKATALAERYETARLFMKKLAKEDNGRRRFASFFFDLDKSVDSIAASTSPNGVHAWTVANRRICGLEVPMVPMMSEMLEARGVHTIGRISRGIHFKKMASRNALTSTMTTETVLMARKEIAAQ